MRDETAYDARTKTIPRHNPLPTRFKQGQIDAGLPVAHGTPDELIWANNPPKGMGYPFPARLPTVAPHRAAGRLYHQPIRSNMATQTFYLGGSKPNGGGNPGFGMAPGSVGGFNLGLNLAQILMLGLVLKAVL